MQALPKFPHFTKESERETFCLARILPFGQKNLIAASDFACNIHLFDMRQGSFDYPIRVMYNSHAKLITDLTFISIPTTNNHQNIQKTSNTELLNFQHFVVSTSMDGFLKIWDLEDSFRPIYEHFSSKKWIFNCAYDPANLCLYLNGEGKHFP